MSRVTRKRFVSFAPDLSVTLVSVDDCGNKKRAPLAITITQVEYDGIVCCPLAREFEDRVDADARMNGDKFMRLVDEFGSRSIRGDVPRRKAP